MAAKKKGKTTTAKPEPDIVKNVMGSIDAVIKKLGSKKKISDDDLKKILIGKNTRLLFNALVILDKMLEGDSEIARVYDGIDGMKVAIDGIKSAAGVIETMYPSEEKEDDFLPVCFHESMRKARQVITDLENVPNSDKKQSAGS